MEIDFDDYALSNIRNIEFEYEYDDYDEEYNVIEDLEDEDLKETQSPVYQYKYKLLSPPEQYSKFTPTQLKYLGVQKQHRPHTPVRTFKPSTAAEPLAMLVNTFQRKVNLLVRAITNAIRVPGIIG